MVSSAVLIEGRLTECGLAQTEFNPVVEFVARFGSPMVKPEA